MAKNKTLNQQVINANYEKQLAEFKVSLKDKTLDELLSLEQEIIKEADENDQTLQDVEFPLKADGYPEVAEAIRNLLEEQSIQWQYTLGMVNIYEFFDPLKRPSSIKFPMLDSVLRTLGGMQFKGYKQWKEVIAINKYVESIRESYIKVTEKIWDIASRHDVVTKQIELMQKQPSSSK